MAPANSAQPIAEYAKTKQYMGKSVKTANMDIFKYTQCLALDA